MNEPVRACLAFENTTTLARLKRLGPGAGLTVVSAIERLHLPSHVVGCQVLLLEEVGDIQGATARVFSLAGANPDVLLVVMVPAPRVKVDSELLRAGAFDVVENGEGLEEQLRHSMAMSRRVLAAQEDKRLLSQTLAHQEKIAAIGVLAAGVSHEVNNPCAAILANVASLREQLEGVMSRPRFQRLGAMEEFAVDALAALSDCVSAAKRISDIVKTLNVFSRKGEHDVSVAFDINEEVNLVLRLLGREVRNQAEFALDLAAEVPKVIGPKNCIAQIATNLLINALDAVSAMPQSERRITVTTEYDESHVVMIVSDNGPGMSSEVLSRIFDPFFTTKAVGKGTGLGLAITRQLVQQMGGDIFVDSAPGDGARFSVFFERRAVEPLPRADEVAAPPSHDRLRLLLVDDEPLFLRAMERSLGRDFEVKTAAGAEEALAILANDQDFDAVVSDVIMPITDGTRFYAQLALTYPSLAERTCFLTGGVTSPQLREALDATGRPCLAKPIDDRELARIVRGLARGESVRRSEPRLSVVQ